MIMKQLYITPQVQCTPINSRELMQTENYSVGGAGNQSTFLVPGRGTIIE